MARRSTDQRTSDAPETSDVPPFEAALERLETIVDELETGELELEQALARFEEGVALSRACAGQLAEARRRIDVLVEENGDLLERPFEADDDEDD